MTSKQTPPRGAWNEILVNAVLGMIIMSLSEETGHLNITRSAGTLEIHTRHSHEWVTLRPSNGLGLIVDYSAALEEELKPVIDYIESWRDN